VLAGEGVVGGECAFAGARRAVGEVCLPRDERATGVAGYAGGAEMVTVQVRHRAALFHRGARAVEVVTHLTQSTSLRGAERREISTKN
jgi:hypothetical protein